MDADTPSQESGSDDAVSQFENLLGKSFGEAPAEPAAKEAKAAPADELITDEVEEEKPDELEEIEDEPTDKKVFKVKVDGAEIEVPEDELIKGYSRQQDYTKKTMELAAQRQQVEQITAQVQSERAQYQAQLNHYAEALGEQLSNTAPSLELLENDPVEYIRQQHLYQARQVAYQSAQQERQRNEQITTQQQAAAEQQRQVHEREQLLANLPSWADDAKAAKEKALIVKSLTAMGRTPEQLGKLDHIDVITARKAVLYDQMVAKAKETTSKVAALPPRMQKPGAPRATDGRTNDMQALRKSGGSMDAAANIFAKLLG